VGGVGVHRIGGAGGAGDAAVPGGVGGGAVDGEAEAVGAEEGHGAFGCDGTSPAFFGERGQLEVGPAALALVDARGGEGADEVDGGELLVTGVGGSPAVVGGAADDEGVGDADDVALAGLELGLLLHGAGGGFVGHVPEFGAGEAVQDAVARLEFIEDAGGVGEAAALDGIPGPRAPGGRLALGAAVETGAGVVGLLDETAEVVEVDEIGAAGNGHPGDGAAAGAVYFHGGDAAIEGEGFGGGDGHEGEEGDEVREK